MGDSGARSSEPASGATSSGRAGWRRWIKSAALLLVAAVSLYLVLPTLLSVFGSWRSLSHLEWFFAVPVFASEAVSYVCLWQLDRIALARGWFAVACAQLAGNAVGRFVPGAPTPFTVEMLQGRGRHRRAAAAFTASTSLQLATTAALPLLALPAIIGGTPVSHSLVAAAYLGVGVLWVLVAARTAAFAAIGRSSWPAAASNGCSTRPFGGAHRWSACHGSCSPTGTSSARPSAAGRRPWPWPRRTRGSTTSRCCSRCGRSGPTPTVAGRARLHTAELLALLPFTPGGLGFVEAGLVGTLTLAGVPGSDALAATLLYRLASYWLPIPAGGVAYLLFRHRYH